MTPLALFLLGCATVFLGTVQAAFQQFHRSNDPVTLVATSA